MNQPFATLSRDPAYRRVAAAISERITGRSLNDGDPLPTELDLAAQFGVTRSTVREALRELESHGLLERRRGSKRLVVTRPATDALVARVSRALALHDVTVREVWEALTILEPPTAELAAKTRRASDLASINGALEAFTASRSTSAAVAAVAEFFDAVDLATGNRALLLAQRPLLPLLSSSLELTIDRVPQARARIVLAQRKLRDAITAGDSAGAHEWMAKHIRDFKRGFDVAGIKLSTPVKISAS